MKKWRGALGRLLLVVSLTSAGLALGTAFRQRPGELMVAPTRVVLEGRTRAAELVVANRGSTEATYRVSLVDMRMTPEGRLERIPDGGLKEGELSAKSLLRFAPRQITLEPGESQRLRIALQKPPGLPPGEYRSHLLLEAIPPALTPSSESASEALALRFNIVGAVSLPAIVRNGPLTASAQIGEPDLTRDELSVRVRRKGSRSVRGDLIVFYIPSGGKRKMQVGMIKEFAVYYPNEFRKALIPLTFPEGDRSGRLMIIYSEPAGASGRVTAEAEMALP